MPPTAAARALLLSAFLAHGAANAAVVRSPRDGTPLNGRALAAELGCAACHAGVAADPDLIRARTPALGPAAPPLPTDFVFSYLADPRRRRDDIGASRMPDFHLDEGERVALALFLGAPPGEGGALADARRRNPGADAALGARIYGTLGCAGCHAGVDGAAPVAGPDLSREGVRVLPEWLRAYLAAPAAVRGPAHPTAPGARMPDFRLRDDEVAALGAYLEGLGRTFATPDTVALTEFQIRRIQRILEDRAACLGCHRIAGRGGAIGPSLEGVGARLRPSFVLEILLDPGRAAPGSPMPHQPLPRRDADRLARYLRALPGEGGPAPRPSLADPANPAWVALPTDTSSAAAALYARHCAACHGAQGRGDGWNAGSLPVPPTAHADPALMSRRADDTLFDGIHAGAWVLDGSPRMPAFGDLLSPEEIRSLVGHIRRLCACAPPAWSRDGRGGAP